MITPRQIRERKISTVESGGYDRAEVNELLLEIIESYEAVYAENKELYRKMEILANRIEEYRADEDSIKTALITAQKMAAQVVSEANEKAEQTASESASSAQQTVIDAKEKADKIIGEARDYVAQLTQEKEQAAQEIVADAQKKADAAVINAKTAAQEVLDKAKELSCEIIEKAKTERTYHKDVSARLRSESQSFKESLISLYESQLDRLREITSQEEQSEADDDIDIDSVESELEDLLSDIDSITARQPAEADSTDEAVQETDAADAQEISDEEIPAEQDTDVHDDAESETESEAENAVEDETEKEIDDIIEEIEEAEQSEPIDEEETQEEPPTEEEIDDAVNAFASDEMTPIDEDAPAIPVIEDEPEFESAAMPFESYFNVNKQDPHNTDETISLIPPDDDEDDDEPSKFKGFFKKKK